MASLKVKVRINGLARVSNRLRYEKLVQPSIDRLLMKAGFLIEGAAKELVPVDTGRLRASITSVADHHRAVIAPTVTYGAHVEYGTRPHWPPLAALQPWARRHGFPAGRAGAYLVALAISRHGTKPRPYMEPATKSSLAEIRGLAEDASREIEERWARG